MMIPFDMALPSRCAAFCFESNGVFNVQNGKPGIFVDDRLHRVASSMKIPDCFRRYASAVYNRSVADYASPLPDAAYLLRLPLPKKLDVLGDIAGNWLEFICKGRLSFASCGDSRSAVGIVKEDFSISSGPSHVKPQ